jgi:hypothetical protein
VAQDYKAVEREAAPLRNFHSQNLFETHVTNFSQVQETQEYMTSRWGLMETYWQAACKSEIKEVWEKALFHSLAMLRLDMSDFMEMRYVTPFILLDLQRDDDAFAFVRYFISLDYLGDAATDDLRRRYMQCQEGDWVYPHEENCRYRDIFQECSRMREDRMPTAFLVAVLVIKFRLVAAYDAARRSIDIAFETTGGQTIQEVQHVVSDMLIDESVVKIENQRQQVDGLINVIHRINPSMLPSVLNPHPLTRQRRPSLSTPGEPLEALHVLLFCMRTLLRVPGASEELEQRFGKMPSYNSFIQNEGP